MRDMLVSGTFGGMQMGLGLCQAIMQVVFADQSQTMQRYVSTSWLQGS